MPNKMTLENNLGKGQHGSTRTKKRGSKLHEINPKHCIIYNDGIAYLKSPIWL